MNQISAEIVADSINIFGDRLTTYILRFPRHILAELNTHRMLSKNSASSRAIPFQKMLSMVWNSPFIPINWMKEHKGMQGTSYFENKFFLWILRNLWLSARTCAIVFAWTLSKCGVTKQSVNRLLEPFMYHTAIVTGSDFENFFALRAHEAAEIHLQDLAHKMLIAYNDSTPKKLLPGEWHLPFGDKMADPKIFKILENQFGIERFKNDTVDPIKQPEYAKAYWSIKLKIAVARTARISYNTFEGKDDYEADIKLHDRLLTSVPLHASPAEHAGRSMTQEEYDSFTKRYPIYDKNGNIINIVTENGWCRNLKGFVQYRALLANDTAKDPRVIQKM
jgi:hypothetical protein